MKGLLLIAFLLGVYQASFSQIIAGDNIVGSTTETLGISLLADEISPEDSAFIDVDCDGTFDLRFKIIKCIGADVPSIVEMSLLNSSIQNCAQPGNPWLTSWLYTSNYSLGQIMDCQPSSSWYTDTTIIVGEYGGFVSNGPASLSDNYIHLKKGGFEGWLKLSFDITGAIINLSLIEYTSMCTIGVSELKPTSDKNVIKITTLMGQETEYKPNTPLIYIYSDGTRERVMKLEE